MCIIIRESCSGDQATTNHWPFHTALAFNMESCAKNTLEACTNYTELCPKGTPKSGNLAVAWYQWDSIQWQVLFPSWRHLDNASQSDLFVPGSLAVPKRQQHKASLANRTVIPVVHRGAHYRTCTQSIPVSMHYVSLVCNCISVPLSHEYQTRLMSRCLNVAISKRKLPAGYQLGYTF